MSNRQCQQLRSARPKLLRRAAKSELGDRIKSLCKTRCSRKIPNNLARHVVEIHSIGLRNRGLGVRIPSGVLLFTGFLLHPPCLSEKLSEKLPLSSRFLGWLSEANLRRLFWFIALPIEGFAHAPFGRSVWVGFLELGLNLPKRYHFSTGSFWMLIQSWWTGRLNFEESTVALRPQTSSNVKRPSMTPFRRMG